MGKRQSKRGPKPSPDSARVTLGVRMSVPEKLEVEAKAAREQKTASAWAREVILRNLR